MKINMLICWPNTLTIVKMRKSIHIAVSPVKLSCKSSWTELELRATGKVDLNLVPLSFFDMNDRNRKAKLVDNGSRYGINMERLLFTFLIWFFTWYIGHKIDSDRWKDITIGLGLYFDIHVLRKRIRSCKRLNLLEANINSLPDEIVFDILVRIPAQDIYGAVRFVCRKWNQMIRTHKFVNTHLQHSTYGLLLKKRVAQSTQLTVMTFSRQGQIELTRLNYEPEHHIWCSSCNGLILECELSNYATFYIVNPVTMQRFSLPPPVYLSSGLGFCFPTIAYASLSMKYKVVRVYYSAGQRGCTILTVGVDKFWRPVCGKHLSLEANKNFTFRPLTTEGFVHWAKRGNYVLTLNLETEIIT
ncbi:hypothetical protein CASFOL_034554 [Castilleja foliolosa]|uniref:F-box domain-containing protein n=1 Tax=Castilleja foliolosa TaxID=1961234 RepID=A0ABD3BQT5_9LAMI